MATLFKPKGRNIYRLRVVAIDGTARVCATGVSDKETGEDMATMCEEFAKPRGRHDLLERIVAGDLDLNLTYLHYADGTLLGWLQELDAEKKAAAEIAADVDLDEKVREWELEGADPKYIKQVRRFIPAGERFPASKFTRGALKKWLAGLRTVPRVRPATGELTPTKKASGGTRNRYKAALSAFAEWLIENEHLEHNPLLKISKFKETEHADDDWHTPAEAQALVAALDKPYGALNAFMQNGLELQVCRRLRRRDIDLEARPFPSVDAHGSKTPHRNRIVRITEAWTLPYIIEHLRGLTPGAHVFTFTSEAYALKHQKAVCRALNIKELTLHQNRNTYAVEKLRTGWPPHLIRKSLGHAHGSRLLEERYGKHIPNDDDYRMAEKRVEGVRQLRRA